MSQVKVNSEIPDSEESTETLNCKQFNSNTSFSDHHEQSSSSFDEFQENKWKSVLPSDVLNKDNYKPIIEITEPHQDVLSEQLIESCSKEFGPILKPGCVAMTRCDLSKQGLKNIAVLKYHKYLTYLDLSANYLSDISCLSYLPFLNYLDVSQNLLTSVLDFEPPINLRFVNLAYNLIGYISDLSSFWSLEYLNLSHNLIEKINGLQNLSLLKHLDLSYNYINKVENFKFSNIQHLILDNNEIKSFRHNIVNERDTPEVVKCLIISMTFNKLDSLEPFRDMPKLEKLFLKNNLIASLGELAYLKNNVMIQSLDLRENPIQKVEEYAETIINFLKRIEYLDNVEIDPGKKGAVKFKFSTNNEVRVRCCNSIIDIISNMASPVVDELYPDIELVPIIALVGPIACGKIRVAKILHTISSNNIHLGVSHTTRPKSKHDIDGVEHYFISKTEFIERLEQGKFITCITKFGHHFGISKEELKKARNAQAIVFCTDICTAMQLKGRFPHCKFIFAMSKSVENHRNWLWQHFYANPWISTSIKTYILSYQAIKTETSEDIYKVKQTCTNILEEIIQYIELIHERKTTETEATDPNTSNAYYDDANWARSVSVTLGSKLTIPDTSKKRQTVSFSQTNDEVFLASDITTINTIHNQTDAINTTTSELYSKHESMHRVDSSLGKLHRILSNRSSMGSKSVQWLNAPSVGINQSWIGSVKHDDNSFGENTSSYKSNSEISHLSSIVTFKEEKNRSTTSTFFNIGSRYTIDNDEGADEMYIIGEEIKEEHPACLKIFIESQLRKRNLYESEFCNNPGLYYYRVYTDKVTESAHLLHGIVNEIVQINAKHLNQWKEKVENAKNQKMMMKKSDYILRNSC